MSKHNYNSLMQLLLADNIDSVKLGLVMLQQEKRSNKYQPLLDVAKAVFEKFLETDDENSRIGCWELEYVDCGEDYNEGNYYFSMTLSGTLMSFEFTTYLESYSGLRANIREYDLRKIIITVTLNKNDQAHVELSDFMNLGVKWVRLCIRQLEGKRIKVTGL